MQTVKTLISLNIIEATLRHDALHDVKASNIIITIAIKQIQHYTDDKFVKKIVLVILNNWKVYSGQMNSEGHISKQNQALEDIFTECSNIRSYLKNFPKTKKKKKNI